MTVKSTLMQINSNSIRNKFDMLTSMINDGIEIFMVLEMKLDSSFTSAQLLIEGYTPPLRYYRNCHDGGNCFIHKRRYVRKDIN